GEKDDEDDPSYPDQGLGQILKRLPERGALCLRMPLEVRVPSGRCVGAVRIRECGPAPITICHRAQLSQLLVRRFNRRLLDIKSMGKCSLKKKNCIKSR